MRTIPPILAGLLVACASGEAPPTGDGDGDTVDASTGTDAIGEVCAKDPCDIYDQCGCDAPQVCDLNFTDGDQLSMGGTACRDVASPGMETASCNIFEYDQCAAGYICLGSAAGTQCRKHCQDDSDCGSGGFCIIEPTSGGNPIPGIKVCTKSCDPVSTNPTGCPAGYGCGVFDNGGTGLSDCILANAAGTDDVGCDDGEAGDPCAPGFLCVKFTSGDPPVEDFRCKQRCEFPGGACNVGTCREFTEGPTPMIGTTAYGFCGT